MLFLNYLLKIIYNLHLQLKLKYVQTAPAVFVCCLGVKLIEGFNTFGVTDDEKLQFECWVHFNFVFYMLALSQLERIEIRSTQVSHVVKTTFSIQGKHHVHLIPPPISCCLHSSSVLTPFHPICPLDQTVYKLQVSHGSRCTLHNSVQV